MMGILSDNITSLVKAIDILSIMTQQPFNIKVLDLIKSMEADLDDKKYIIVAQHWTVLDMGMYPVRLEDDVYSAAFLGQMCLKHDFESSKKL